MAPLGAEGQRKQQQRHRDQETQRLVERDARGGKRQRADRQIVAKRKHQEAEGDEDAAGDVVATQSHGLSVPLALISPSASPSAVAPQEGRGPGAPRLHAPQSVIGRDYPSTLPMERMAASMRLLSASQNAANSGWSIYASSWPRLASAALNCSPCAALFSSSRR